MQPRVMARRIVQRTRERFERRFGAVVVVIAGQQSDVQRKTAFVSERLQQVRDQLAAQAANHRPAERQVDARPGSPTEIDRDLGQRFVKWNGRVAKATDATSLTQSLVQCLTEAESHVFGGVVLIDVEVALSFDGQVEPRMPSQAIKHVVQEADTCSDVRPA